jgi:hypothetical protein
MPSLPSYIRPGSSDTANDNPEYPKYFHNSKQPACPQNSALIEPSGTGSFENYCSNQRGEDVSVITVCEAAFRGRRSCRNLFCHFIAAAVLLICSLVFASLSGKSRQQHQMSHMSGGSSPSRTSTAGTKRPPFDDPREQLTRPVSPAVTATTASPTSNSSMPSGASVDDPQIIWNNAESDLYHYLVSLVGPDSLSVDSQSATYAAYRWLASDESLSIYTPQIIKQRLALACLYYATNGGVKTDKAEKPWKNIQGWMSYSSECQWHGVQCRDGHIVSVNLTENGLEGRVPQELSLFSDSLLKLELGGNDITNAFDELAFLGDLKKLKILNFQDTFVASHGVPTYLSTLTSLGELYEI